MTEFCQQVHPYWRNDDLLKGMKELGIHVTAYSPLGSEVKDQPSLLQDETLKKVRSRACTPVLYMRPMCTEADSPACVRLHAAALNVKLELVHSLLLWQLSLALSCAAT